MRCPSSLLPLLGVAVLLTSGCAAASAVGAAIGAAFSGLAYISNSNGSVERTFVVTLPEVWGASISVLRLMDLTISEGTRDEKAGELKGTAPDLTVTLTLSRVTVRATRVTIEAVEGTYGRDRATAAEVLNQLALLLPPPPAAGHPGTHPLVPPPRDPRGAPSAGPGDLEQPKGEVELHAADGGEARGPASGASGADPGLPSAGEAGEDCGAPRSPQEDLG